MKGVDPRLPPVEMRRWDPLGVAVGIFAGGPALFGEFVVGAAGQGEVVDVGDGVGGVGVAVVGLAEVGGHAAAGERASAVFGVQHDSVGGRGDAFGGMEHQRVA